MKYILGFLFLCFAFNIPLTAQNKQHIEHKVQSKAFDKERTIRVFLPERYLRDSTSEYIVIYVLDAHDDQVWHMATGIIDYMVSRYTVIPMMAVGIASDNRGAEFTPGSPELHQHFIEDVFPLVESTYRTLPHRTIIGHSWGGAFVGNTLFGEHSDLFDAYLGISPSLNANDNVIFNQTDSLLQMKKDFRKFFYYSAGDVGFEEGFKERVMKMDLILKHGQPKNLAWISKLFDGKDHFSALPAGINDGLQHMSRNYFADQKLMEDFASHPNKSIREQVKEFNAEKEKNFGFVHKPSVAYYRFTADEFRDKEQYKAAVEVYLMGLEVDSQDVKISFNLADAYDKMGKLDLAEELFTSSLELLENQKDNLSDNYYTAIKEWATKKVEGYKK